MSRARRADRSFGALVEQPRLDLLWVPLLVALHLGAVTLDRAGDPLGDVGVDGRRTAYKYLLTASIGFAAAAWAAITYYYGSNPGRRLQDLRRYKGKVISRIGQATLLACWYLLVVTVVALTLDTNDGDRHWVRWGVEAALLLLAVRLVRIVALSVVSMRLRGFDDSDRLPEPATSWTVAPRQSRLTDGEKKKAPGRLSSTSTRAGS